MHVTINPVGKHSKANITVTILILIPVPVSEELTYRLQSLPETEILSPIGQLSKHMVCMHTCLKVLGFLD
jgi:hypothetical protein